ncbi:MAG: hypothetical protein DRR00_33845 [Candidatus Parabeggiatoa sp. nov. 3]|nr:MAG: hypothetical protein DRR00_33845 [Gammaproteobacteria bacterium]
MFDDIIIPKFVVFKRPYHTINFFDRLLKLERVGKRCLLTLLVTEKPDELMAHVSLYLLWADDSSLPLP